MVIHIYLTHINNNNNNNNNTDIHIVIIILIHMYECKINNILLFYFLVIKMGFVTILRTGIAYFLAIELKELEEVHQDPQIHNNNNNNNNNYNNNNNNNNNGYYNHTINGGGAEHDYNDNNSHKKPSLRTSNSYSSVNSFENLSSKLFFLFPYLFKTVYYKKYHLISD